MLHLFGQVVSRGWVFLLAGWIALAVGTRLAAPPWDEVAQDKEFAFLPADAPSRRSEEVFARAFPEDRFGSNVVLVVHHPGNEPADPDRDLKFIEDVLERGLRKIAEAEGGLAAEAPPSEAPLFPGDEPAPPPKPVQRSIIARIQTPNAPGAGALLVSPDRQAMLVVVELTTEFLASRNWPTITRIEDLVRSLRAQGNLPPGVDISITGSAVIGRDHDLAELQSTRATELLTVVLVVVLLVLIYRAPFLALIPLATVFVAVQVALNLLAILAGAGHITLFQGIQIYVTILAYGAGVDYCLFLMARYREELDHGASPRDALAAAVGGVGAALAASAATVMCGIGMMMFAQFGKFRDAGFAIPLSIFLVLAATLTFSPTLLRLAGRWAFWPYLNKQCDEHVPPVQGIRAWLSPGALTRIWDRVGQALLRRPGTIWLATVAVMAPFVAVAGLFYNRLSYDLVGDLPANSPSVHGTGVLVAHFPAGLMGPASALIVSPHLDFDSPQGRSVVSEVTDRLRDREGELGLADIRSLTAPLGITPASKQGLGGLRLPKDLEREVMERGALRHYVTDLGERAKIGTRLDLIFQQSPFSHRSIGDLDRVEQVIREALPAEHRQDSQLYFVGATVSVRDLQTVMRGDRTRIELLVLASVFVVLVVLLRRLVVPVYLLLSVLFSYYATMGVSFVVFWLLDPAGFAGIDWKVAIFLFTILIAVGEDYNIFLMARVREEQQYHGPLLGITAALDRTGPIISSCGIIMAGTFASLLAGSLTEMKQLGFALAFGILLDTFVVRPILVPAFLILFRRKPGGTSVPLVRGQAGRLSHEINVPGRPA